MNKYEKWYASIVENAKDRKLDCYKETHHIVPRSIGGTDDKTNLVDLTAREHFICHWLLVHIHKGPAQHKMVYALNGMKRNGKDHQRYETPITSRVYAKLRVQFSIVHSATMSGRPAHNKGVPATADQKAKQSAKMAGRKQSADTIAKRVASQIGGKRSAETKAKMSASAKLVIKGPRSDVTKENISKATKGKKKSAAHIEKRTATLKELAASGQHHSTQKKICPHCGTEMNRILYGRWHGDKCKSKKDET
jgi:ribosomal protein L37AE/L43A